MASIPLVSGGSQPVFAIDTLNGPQLASNVAYTPAATPTNFAGPALEFYQIGNLTGIQNQAQVNGAIQYIDIALQQVCTIAIQQANANSLSIATYPLGAFGANAATSATALQAIVQALGANVGGTGLNASGAAVTNLGFKLSAT
jgi:hypothetical protein